MADRSRGIPGPYPAVVRHVGRRSGRSFETPVIAQQAGETVFIPLPYGADTDWCLNVLAAGEFTLRQFGKSHTVKAPGIVEAAEGLPAFPGALRLLLRLFGVRQFLHGRLADSPATTSHAPGA